MLRLISQRGGLLGTGLGALAVMLTGWCSPALANESVWACGSSYDSGVFAAAAAPSMTARAVCPALQADTGLELYNGPGGMTRGDSARFQANAPSGLEIVAAGVPSMVAQNVNSSQGFGGGFYWQGGGSQVTQYQSAALLGGFSSPYFGFQLICGVNTCTSTPGAEFFVSDIVLSVSETVAPTLTAPTGLWQASGWVRGSWPFFAWGNSPSGLCSISATLNGEPITTTTSKQDPSTWHQCAAPPVDQPVNTSRYGQDAIPLTLSADDAAGVPASTTKTVDVDNQQPTVTLSGPSDAATTAGTQYVSATASAGPSGVAGIACSVDGAPAQWYPGSSAQVPVSGVGENVIKCSSENNAVDGNGIHGTSAPGSFSMKIGVPTISGIAFSRIVDQLRCHRVRERIEIPARWVKVQRHHKLVRVHRRAHRETTKVTRCHPRTEPKTIAVWITVRRHGKKVRVKRHKTVRVIVTPRTINSASRRVGYGQATEVSGWLGTTAGISLPAQTVAIMTAADNGQGQFRTAALATTTADGSWSATLPAGPSRLVKANYGGGPTTEPAASGFVHLVVPAKVELFSVSPKRIAWGATVQLTGRLAGGYLPSDGALLRLRIGSGSTYSTYGIKEHVIGNGRFSTRYTFGAGDPNFHRAFWFQIGSLPIADYPYAPAESQRRYVLVGGHPPHRRHSNHHKKRRQR